MDVSSLIQNLEKLLPAERVSAKTADLEAASRDESSISPVRPDVVVWPHTTEEVQRVIRFAYQRSLSVTARGAGSSLEGNPIPVRGGIVLDLSRMQEIIAIHADDLQVVVQPGVVYNRLNDKLKSYGLFFPPAPGGSSDVATIGGMVANNASGIYAVKYGGTREYVRAATVVTGTGEILALGNRCRKSSSGYHLIGLLVGSEGTLAIATEFTLSLAPLPPERKKGAFVFPSEKAAVSAIAEMMRFGVDIAAAEFLDRNTVATLNRYKQFGLEEQPSLFLEIHGSRALVEEVYVVADTLCREKAGKPIHLPDRQDPWEVRHFVTRSIQALNPAGKIVRADVAFPVSLLPAVVERSYAIAAGHRVNLHAFGHAGMGILHTLMLVDPQDHAGWKAAHRVKEAIIEYVISRGGTTSGEHGIGLGNRMYSAREHGPALELMKGIKTLFDPRGILNPGKIW